MRAVRELYRAYETGEREAVAQLLGESFIFFSPADVGLYRDRYWERCWPNAGVIARFEFKRLIEVDKEVVVTYEATRRDGSRFRNTEILTFDGDKLARAEVYFGWNLS
jgi:ketosteroid isomerase-like protein